MKNEKMKRMKRMISTCGCASVLRCPRVAAQGYGAVREQPTPVVSGERGFCVWGDALGAAGKVTQPPSPEGQHPARRHTRHSFADLQGARAEEIPDCSSYSPRIPWIATAVGCQATHARLPRALTLSPVKPPTQRIELRRSSH